MIGPMCETETVEIHGASLRAQTVADQGVSFIYCLRCPKTKSVRYIGKSKNPQKRLMAHISAAATGRLKHHQSQWTRSLLSAGMAPEMAVLFTVPVGIRWQDAEKFFIASAKAFGFDLTNANEGGGCENVSDQDQIAARSRAAANSWLDPVIRERRLQALRLANSNPALLQKKREIAAKPDFKAAKSASMRELASTPESRIRASKHFKEVWSRPEMMEKKIAATKAAWSDPEAAARRGAAISKAKLLWWARKKAAQAAACK